MGKICFQDAIKFLSVSFEDLSQKAWNGKNLEAYDFIIGPDFSKYIWRSRPA